MKKSLSRSRVSRLSGFTLVELLVVIGIIAILAGILLGVTGPAFRAAQRVKAANLASQIQTAVSAYDTEYGVYPVGTATADGTPPASISDSDAADWGVLIDALCGNISASKGTAVPPTTIANSRVIAFLTFRSTDVDTHDAPLNPLPPDPINHIYFNIAMDADYDGILGAPPSTAVLPNFSKATSINLPLSGGSSTAGVAVWANCTTKPNNAVCNPNFWVHTY